MGPHGRRTPALFQVALPCVQRPQITFQLGSVYGWAYSHGVFELKAGDLFNVFVGGAGCTGQVSLTTPISCN